MKLFKVLGQQGHWAVGYAQIVVANDKTEAEVLAIIDIKANGLHVSENMTLEEIPLNAAASHMLHNGEY